MPAPIDTLVERQLEGMGERLVSWARGYGVHPVLRAVQEYLARHPEVDVDQVGISWRVARSGAVILTCSLKEDK